MQNKNRIILHIDFNSYFASVEQQANPFLRGKAIAIGGKPNSRSVVSTSSLEARKLGVKTAMPSSTAMKRAPNLQMISGDVFKYKEITNRFLNILNKHADIVEQFSIDEAFIDVTNRCEDHMDAIAVALRIRDDIKTEIGPAITASIGISDNKIMAKIASESEKPNGVTIVYSDEKEEFLNTRQLSDVPGVGFSILRRLEEMGITSFQELRSLPLSYLLKHFKQTGSFLYNIARGINHSPVSNIATTPKSIGHSQTLPFDTRSEDILSSTLLHLSNKVAWRLRKHNMVAHSFTAIVRLDTLSFKMEMGNFDAATADGLNIHRAAWSKLAHLTKTQNIRLIGITVRNLVPSHQQISISPTQRKHAQLIPALDEIQRRYGAGSWLRASELIATRIHNTQPRYAVTGT